MEKIKLSHRGFGNGSVPVNHAPNGDATILEFQSRLGTVRVFGLVDTPERMERGEELLSLRISPGRARCIVPRFCTHVLIEARSVGSGLGIPLWRLGFRSSGSCQELGGTVHGRINDVFRYRGPMTVARFEIGNQAYANVRHLSPAGEQQKVLLGVSGPYRGQFEIPGPGLIEVDSTAHWSLSLSE